MRGKNYTKEEDKFIIDNHKKMSIKEIAEKINRTEYGIYKRMQRLGLEKTFKRREYTNEEDKIICEYWDTHTTKQIADILNRSAKSVYNRAMLLCLSSSSSKYVVYRGDKLLCEGTADECAEAAGVKKIHIWRSLTPSHKESEKQYRETGRRLHVYRVEKEGLA